MTENPVAAANARTMWKRETPPIAAISSSVNAPARWLSIYQSAFWAGFITSSFRSKPSHHDRQHHALFGPRIRLRHHRQDRGGLLQQDQYRRRHQRPQARLHFL